MFLVPIAHERNTARRWPIVAILLVAANVLLFSWTEVASKSARERAGTALVAAARYAQSHPHLELKCRSLPPRPTTPVQEILQDELEQQQAKLDGLCVEADRLVYALPTHRFGDVPARGGALTLFSHQFLHGGYLHLLFNLWFLWLTAVNMEDRWGRFVFVAFYLCAGVVGALLHRYFAPTSWLPLVGASGAIAGAMGGFLVLFARTKIRFFYFFMFFLRPKVGTFDAPAYLMLPLWFGVEILSGVISPSDGTAHWAHVGGFAFGAAVAAGLKVTGVDARLDRGVEEVTTYGQDPRILEASALVDQGRVPDAIALLDGFIREHPESVDARLELLRAASVTKDSELRARVTVDLMGLYLSNGEVKPATDLLLELHQSGMYVFAPRDRLLAIAERCAAKGEVAMATQMLSSLHRGGMVDEVAVRAAVTHARLLLRTGQPEDARMLLERAKTSPFSTLELDSKIDAQLAAVDRDG